MGNIQSALLKNLSCTRGRSRLAKPLEWLKILQTPSCLSALLHPSQPANRASIPRSSQCKAKQAGERPLQILWLMLLAQHHKAALWHGLV